MKIKSYYDRIKFAYVRPLLNKNGFEHCGDGIDGIRKVSVFIYPKFNVYVDCIDREYPKSAEETVRHANGKPFLYLKTAYSPSESKNIIDIVEKGGGKIEPFFKWCGANSSDGFYKNLYPRRRELVILNKTVQKHYDIGFCCSLNHPAENVSVIRRDFHNKFNNAFGNKFFHSDKLGYGEYIQKILTFKTSFNCPGVGEYTSRMFDACAIGIPAIIRKTDYDNALSWKEYIPEIDFEAYNWVDELTKVFDEYKEWGDKCLYYYENFWTPDAIFNHMMSRIDVFREMNGL